MTDGAGDNNMKLTMMIMTTTTTTINDDAYDTYLPIILLHWLCSVYTVRPLRLRFLSSILPSYRWSPNCLDSSAIVSPAFPATSSWSCACFSSGVSQTTCFLDDERTSSLTIQEAQRHYAIDAHLHNSVLSLLLLLIANSTVWLKIP